MAQTQTDMNIVSKVPKITKVRQFIIIVKPRVTQAKHFTAMQPKTLSCQLDMVRKVAKQTTMAIHQIKIAKAVINYAPTSATAQLKDFTFKTCQKDCALVQLLHYRSILQHRRRPRRNFKWFILNTTIFTCQSGLAQGQYQCLRLLALRNWK